MEVKSSTDWADLEKGILYVRDRKLLSLIKEADFVDAIFHFWLHKKPTRDEKRMLNAVLVSFCGGWNIIAPVVYSAKLAATTRSPMAQCLAAGFSASGPAHTSAIHDIMEVYLKHEEDDMENHVLETLKNGGKVPGFGHPVLPKDPRPDAMRKLCDEFGMVGDAVRKFDIIQNTVSREKGIYGNIDGINGAILIDLGFRDPSYGPAMFLLSRSLSMTANIIEEYKNRPWSALDLVYPGYGRIRYGYGDSLER